MLSSALLSFALTASLGAAPARTLPGGEPTLFVPRLDKAAPLFAWLQQAGARAPLLRPASWRAELSPLLGLDVSDLEALKAAGIDPTGPATFNFRGDDRAACFTLKDVGVFEARVKERLRGMGEPWKAKANGAALTGAALGTEKTARVLAGYVLRGKEACTASSEKDVAPALKELAASFGKAPAGRGWAKAAKLPGVAFVVTSRGVAGLRAEGDKAIAEGSLQETPGVTLGSAAETPYASIAPSGLFFARFRMGKLSDYAEAYAKRNLKPCRFCDAALNEALSPLAAAVAKSATGNALVRVEQFALKGSLRSEAAQYFALKNATLFELADAAEVKKALEALAGAPGAKKTPDGVAFTLREGELALGLSGAHFYVANDPALAGPLLEGAGKAKGKAAHAAEWTVDPSRVTRAFSQISLLDVMGSRELAGLFAVGTELGPLFGQSQLVSGTADPDVDGSRFTATWQLKPAAPKGGP